MSPSSRTRAPITGAAMGLLVFTSLAAAQERNCPALVDQVIHVAAAQPVTFRLAVANADASAVSIFQYPLGGILQHTGPTSLDYTFVPGPAFNGTTTFTYRLTPPPGCVSGDVLGKVTLAGGPATSTATGLDVNPQTGLSEPPAQQNIDPVALLALFSLLNGGLPCGLGILPFFALTALALVGMRLIRRR